MKSNIAVAVILCTLYLSSCTDRSTDTAGSGATGVHGKLYSADLSPAVNASVSFVPVGFDPSGLAKRAGSTICSTRTDANGEYQIDSVETGVYNVIGEGSNGDVSFQDSVAIVEGANIEVDADTLLPPGAATFVVNIQAHHDPRNVDVIIWGTQFGLVPIDSTGLVFLSGIPQGTYSVRIKLSTEYDVLDTSLLVMSADTTDMDTLVLPFLGIPIPQDLSIQYDTLFQIVNLNWNQCDTALVSGYYVYRQHSDSTFVMINSALLTDTTYADSSNTTIEGSTYSYRISSVDKNANIGYKSAQESVLIASAFQTTASIAHKTFDIIVDEQDFIIALTLEYIVIFDSSLAVQDSIYVGRSTGGHAIDTLGRIWVSYWDDDIIKLFSRAGDSLASFSFGSPQLMRLYSAGRMIVRPNGGDQLHLLDFDGNLVSLFPNSSSPLTRRYYALKVDSAFNIWTSDVNDSTLSVYATDGSNLLQRKTNGQCYEIVNMANGFTLLCETFRNRQLHLYDPEFVHKASFGDLKLSSGKFATIYDAQVDSKGRLIVSTGDEIVVLEPAIQIQ